MEIVLTIIAPDRPGIVGLLAQELASAEASWLESRLAHLSGQFAGIVRAQLPDHQLTTLQARLTTLHSQGIQTHLSQVPSSPHHPRQATPEGQAARIELVGPDRPGIVREISRALASLAINVEEMSSNCVPAPMSGEPLFSASLSITLPLDGPSADQLASRLEEIAHSLTLDLSIVPQPA
jgi:glycine cleavage system regulatory protein